VSDYKEVMLASLREAYSLDKKDAIYMLDSTITIKLYQFDDTMAERRFEGLPSSELAALKVELFQNSVTEFLDTMIKVVLKSRLDINLIDNDFFEKHHLKILQQEFRKIITKKMKQSEVVSRAFSNYLLRENFLLVHQKIAIHIIALLQERTPKAENFLKYYSGGTKTFEGIKYQIPQIIDCNERVWVMRDIKSITYHYYKNEQAVERYKKICSKFENIVEVSQHQKEEAKKRLNEYECELQGVIRDIAQIQNELSESEIELTMVRSNSENIERKMVISVNDRIAELKSELREVFQEKSEFSKEILKLNTEISTLKEKIEHAKNMMQKELSNKQEHLKKEREAKENYHLMIDALAYALIKKRELC
jgi:chromosome segregation ATPase